MNEYQLNQLMSSEKEVELRLEKYKSSISLTNPVVEEIKGHLDKAEHNLIFASKIGKNFSDWLTVVCYYLLYHMALALILKKGFFSKNHEATLCLLIKEYHNNLTLDDINLLNNCFFDKEDVLFYASTKENRKNASYSTKFDFIDKNILLKTRLLFNKMKNILDY